MSATRRFEARIGRGLSLLEFSAPFAECEAGRCVFSTFPTREMTKIRRHGAIPLFSWNSGASGGNPEDFQLADIRSGRYDSYIRDFARAAREWGHPFFLRFNWEMNGSWFPWGVANGNLVWEFSSSWRHVHRIFDQVGATDVSWVWCPFVGVGLDAFYPGDRYVDWTCLDGYNWGPDSPPQVPWQSFRELFSSSYSQVSGEIAPRKPMLIGEVASAGPPAAKAAWIRGMFASLRRGFGKVHGLVWFDKVDRGVDWPLETSPLVSRTFAAGLRRGYRENVFSRLDRSPIPPPRCVFAPEPKAKTPLRLVRTQVSAAC
jgi:hypothetical protein